MAAMVWCPGVGAVSVDTAVSDDAVTASDSLQIDDSTSSYRNDDSDTAVSDAALSPGDDYTFTEEYRDTDRVQATENDPSETPAQPRKKRYSPGRGDRFLSVVAVLRLLAEKYTRFLSEPVILLKKHAVKLAVLTVSLLVILFTLSFYRERRERGRFLTTTRLSVMDKEVQRACRYIEEHFDEPDLDINRICAALVTGTAFLEALFVKELGLTIEDFIAQVRINRARIILGNDTRIATGTLAGQCGFSDENHFLECFSSITGGSLDEYRGNLAGHTDAAG